jgi:monooxygenase
MTVEYLDVLVVGAGVSGLCAAWHLQDRCPSRSYAVLEARAELGGTWDLFRYPGVRSDSDMQTYAYRFRPWPGASAIADGASIRQYLRDTAHEYGIDRRIRYGHRVRRASWSSHEARWTLDVEREGAPPLRISCGFLLMCSGYFDHAQGHLPAIPGIERFAGTVVHPQHWPADLDWTGRRVVVIGSGATAVTIVPAMARAAAHVTMLQRSPSYVLSMSTRDPVAAVLRAVLPARAAHALVRWRNLLLSRALFRLCRRFPKRAARLLIAQARRQLPAGYDVATHFTPRYDPWTQRLCLVPDGDLFAAIRAGRASVATDQIESFTGTGLRLRSGAALDADIVVTATGLELAFLGGLEVIVDERPVDLTQCLPYKGCMFGEVPNLATVFGYTNASWTLRADLVCDFVCRLLNHTRKVRMRWCVPRRRGASPQTEPWVDFSSGYFRRGMDRFPRQGVERPWRTDQDFLRDIASLRFAPIDDGVMEFGGPAGADRGVEVSTAA